MKKDNNTSYFVFDTTSKKDNKKTSDCVIRSISLAMGISWTDVFDELCEIARKEYDIPNTPSVYKKFLKKHGWEMMPCPKNGTHKIKAKDFAKQTNGQRIVAHVGTGHLSCFIDGKIHDTWNCGEYCVGNYWIYR